MSLLRAHAPAPSLLLLEVQKGTLPGQFCVLKGARSANPQITASPLPYQSLFGHSQYHLSPGEGMLRLLAPVGAAFYSHTLPKGRDKEPTLSLSHSAEQTLLLPQVTAEVQR